MTNPQELAERMAAKSDSELLAMFASPEDWTPEAMNSANAELRKRGLDPAQRVPLRSGSANDEFDPPAEPAGHDDRPDIYHFFGTYPNEDARRLLEAFVLEDIAYTLDLDQMGLAEMSPFQAANGGTFGAAVGVAIGVHADDCDQAMAIRQRVLKIIA